MIGSRDGLVAPRLQVSRHYDFIFKRCAIRVVNRASGRPLPAIGMAYNNRVRSARRFFKGAVVKPAVDPTARTACSTGRTSQGFILFL